MKEELAPGFDRRLVRPDHRSRSPRPAGRHARRLHQRARPHAARSPAGSGGGRDHWSRVYSSLIAGGGTARGKIVGASDKQAGDVADRPISPKDLLATMYHLLGIDPHTLIHDRQGRPLPLVEGQVIREALA